jgi:hypothetical protein
MPVRTRTLRSSCARFELAMGTYCALSWKVHQTHPKGICPMCITKMCIVTARDRHIFFGQWGKKRRSRHYFCTACNQGSTWFTVFPYLTMDRASSTLCSGDPWLRIQVQTSVGRFSLFLSEPLVPVIGADFKNRLDSFFFLNSHFENHPGFQNFVKNPVRQFSGLAVLTEF